MQCAHSPLLNQFNPGAARGAPGALFQLSDTHTTGPDFNLKEVGRLVSNVKILAGDRGFSESFPWDLEVKLKDWIVVEGFIGFV